VLFPSARAARCCMPTHVACARVAHARVVVSCAQRQRRRRQGWRRHGQAHARHSRIGGEGVVLVSVVPVQCTTVTCLRAACCRALCRRPSQSQSPAQALASSWAGSTRTLATVAVVRCCFTSCATAAASMLGVHRVASRGVALHGVIADSVVPRCVRCAVQPSRMWTWRSCAMRFRRCAAARIRSAGRWCVGLQRAVVVGICDCGECVYRPRHTRALRAGARQ
jgi:hypothetical protein